MPIELAACWGGGASRWANHFSNSSPAISGEKRENLANLFLLFPYCRAYLIGNWQKILNLIKHSLAEISIARRRTPTTCAESGKPQRSCGVGRPCAGNRSFSID